MKLRCKVSGRARAVCEHCHYDGGDGEWGKTAARLVEEWETDRRDLWRRALEVRQTPPKRKQHPLIVRLNFKRRCLANKSVFQKIIAKLALLLRIG